MRLHPGTSWLGPQRVGAAVGRYAAQSVTGPLRCTTDGCARRYAACAREPARTASARRRTPSSICSTVTPE